MKRALTILLLGVACRAFAQVPVALNAYAEYAYNHAYGHFATAGALVDADLAKNFTLHGGINLQTANVYAATLGGRVRFGLPIGHIFIDNEYLYKALVRNHTQQLCAALSVGYAMDYVSVRAGLFSKYFCALPSEKYGKSAAVIEPFNLLYEVQAFIFRPTHKWNLGLKVSNVDYFQWEHPTDPCVSLLGNCQLTERLRFVSEFGCRPAGIFNIAANFYAISFRAGICYKW